MRYVDLGAATGTTERNTTAAGESTGQRRPNEGANPQPEVPPTTTDGTLSGPLQQLSHVQRGQASNASPVDNNPLVTSTATGAAREALASVGEGAPADMIQALAAWLASHVRARRATRAPNHWCWSITAVCWLIARAMRHNGADQGLSCRSLAARFGMNAAGMRQRPIASWEAEGTTCDYTFNPGTLPQVHRASARTKAWSRTPTQEPLRSQLAMHLDRLVQITWAESRLEDTRSAESNDDPQASDIDIRAGNDNASEGTAMSVDREEERAQASAGVAAGALVGEQEGEATPPDTGASLVGNATRRPTHNDEETQANGDNLRPESLSDGNIPCTQGNKSLHEDRHNTNECRIDRHPTNGDDERQPGHDNTKRVDNRDRWRPSVQERSHFSNGSVHAPRHPVDKL